jgi:hypothetical protein
MSMNIRRSDESTISKHGRERKRYHVNEQAVGGATTVGWRHHAQGKIGIMVAGNSGRPAGACGNGTTVQRIHSHHTTQEEDIVSCWMTATCGSDRKRQNLLFQRTIAGRWGMKNIGNSTSVHTVQYIDYVNTRNPRAYATPAFVVQNALVCEKSARGFETQNKYQADLVFVAGPNVSQRGSATGSMRRTSNRHAFHNYTFFRTCVKHALRAGIDRFIQQNVDIALVARLSCGIYAGPYVTRIQTDFDFILDEVLNEPLHGKPRGQYFRKVIVPMLG